MDRRYVLRPCALVPGEMESIVILVILAGIPDSAGGRDVADFRSSFGSVELGDSVCNSHRFYRIHTLSLGVF